MIKKELFAILMVIGILSMFAAPLLAVENERFYYEYLDHKILLCKSKSHRIGSKSEYIRKYAQKHLRMAQYLVRNRDRLVREMVAENIEPKAYKMDYFLNERYREKWANL